MVGEDGNDPMEDSEHGLWDDLKYQWGCVGRRRRKVGGMGGRGGMGGMDRREGGMDRREGRMDRREGGRGREEGWEGEMGFKKQYNVNVSCTHHFLTYLPDIADQLPGVVCRHTSQVRAACLVDPLAGEVES